MASLMRFVPGPKKYRPYVLGGAAAAAYLLFRTVEKTTPAASSPAPAPAPAAPMVITVAPGTVTYTPGSPTGYAVMLPADGSNWVTLQNGKTPSSLTAGVSIPVGSAPDGVYVWNDMTHGGQSTTTIAPAAAGA